MTFPLYRLELGASGQAVCAAQLDRLIAESKRAGVTDLIFLAHGFRCDAAEATGLYTSLLANLSANLDRAEFSPLLAHRTFAAAGVYWPSQRFPESVHESLAGLRVSCSAPDRVEAIDHAETLLDSVALNRNAQDRFVASVLSAFDDGRNEPTEGLPLLHEWRGSDLLDKLGASGGASDGEGGIRNLGIFDPIRSRIDIFLNFMTWSAMKNLAGKVGEDGLAASVLACRHELGDCRIHLVGHSLGGRLMTACCKALGRMYQTRIESLSLLEAAFSHFGFSPNAGWGEPGFFREVIESRIVRGPIISTFSRQDAVVGTAYAVASRLVRDRLQSLGDASDSYGGIGHNGAQRTPESIRVVLHQAGQPYELPPGIVTCLDGSAGTITNHGDVTNTHVTYAIGSAISEIA